MQKMEKLDYSLFTKICTLTEENLSKVLYTTLQNKYDSVVKTDDYIFAEGNIPICLVAHLDTVFEVPPTEVYYDRDKNVIWSPQGGIGDDRAGVFAILKILQSGLKPHIIFTSGEEVGGIGSFAITSRFKNKSPFRNLKYIIQLDRRGSSDCVFYESRCPEFEKYVESFGFITAFGTFSDISILCPYWDIAGVNLSIGYQNEHSQIETLNVSAMFSTIEKVKKMLKDCGNVTKFKPIFFNSCFALTKEEEFSFDETFCASCGKRMSLSEGYQVLNEYLVCEDCYKEQWGV